MKIKPDMDRIQFLLGNDAATEKSLVKFRKRLYKRKTPLIYVRPHVRNLPKLKTPLFRLMELIAKKAKIEAAIKDCKQLLRSTLPY